MYMILYAIYVNAGKGAKPWQKATKNRWFEACFVSFREVFSRFLKEDLSGADTAKKSLILARELGLQLEHLGA